MHCHLLVVRDQGGLLLLPRVCHVRLVRLVLLRERGALLLQLPLLLVQLRLVRLELLAQLL